MNKITQYELLFDEDRMLYLIKDKEFKYKKENMPMLDRPDSIASFMNKAYKFNKLASEKLYAVVCDNALRGICIIEISAGDIDSSLSCTHKILSSVLKTGWNKFFLVHNHPSGSEKPSKEDIATTKEIMRACNLTGLRLLDHIIIGGKKYTSLMEGYL